MPGAFLVDLVPACTFDIFYLYVCGGIECLSKCPSVKYLPSWLPFNNIHKIGRAGRELAYSARDRPYDYVQEQMKQGIGRPSCTAEFIRTYESETGNMDSEAENLIKWGAGSLYAREPLIIGIMILTFRLLPQLRIH